LLGTVYGVTWMGAQALVPAAIGRGLDQGVSDHDLSAAAEWSGVVLGLAVVQAVAGVLRHRVAVANWLYASYRSMQLLGRHSAEVGVAIRRKLPTGEVVSAATNDALMIGGAFDVSARLSGAVVSYLIVAVLLLTTNVLIGTVVLVGVPVMVVLLGPLMRPLQSRQKVQREVAGQLTSLGADTVAGLRVLRGIGGEPAFLARYRRRSLELRDAGVRVATLQALLDSAQVLLPGIFLVTLTWLGARLAIEGKLTPGDIVAFYGYAFFLVVPIRTAIESADKFTRSLVGAARIIDVLVTQPEISEPKTPATPPPAGSVLADALSGLTVEPGLMTGLVGSDPAETTAIAERLGRLVEHDGVTLGDVPLEALPLDTVRHRILVSEAEPRLFTGTLRDQLDPWERAVDDGDVLEALRVAAADDVLEAMPEGLDSSIDEGGREFSGGQRQRLALARTLLTDAEVLVLIDPTSAVDAHTEALVAGRLRDARHETSSGVRTTVITSASPLLLTHCDDVVFVRGGVVEARGTHRDLLADHPAYRDTVTRGEDM
jgi:ABC-type multidrug transport system fused ATPase/permease subunit